MIVIDYVWYMNKEYTALINAKTFCLQLCCQLVLSHLRVEPFFHSIGVKGKYKTPGTLIFPGLNGGEAWI